MARRRRAGKRTAPIAALAVLAAAVAVAVGFLAMRPEIDTESLCPVDGNYGRTAVLIDATDALTRSQAKAIREEVDDLLQRLEDHEWVGVFVLSEENVVAALPEFEKCNPGSDPNPLIENPMEVLRRFREEFRKPIDDALDRLLDTTEPSPTSPILEMIRAVSLESNFSMTKQRRLVIVSDMLHNVPQYSHYRDGFDFDGWRSGDYAQDVLEASLLGVEVEMLYLRRGDQRSGPLQTYRHVRFWEDYFRALGATLKVVKPIR